MREANLTALMSVSIENLRDRVIKLTGLVYGNFPKEHKSQITRDFFLHALSEDMKLKVLAGKPKTLEDTVSMAKSCLLICQKEDIPVSAYRPKQVNTKRRGVNKVQCFNCKGFGHIAKMCSSARLAELGVEANPQSEPGNALPLPATGQLQWQVPSQVQNDSS